MAKISLKHEHFGGDAVRLSWSNIKSGDTCEESQYPTYQDRSIQVSGEFSGAQVRLDGSNDGVSYFPLTNLRGNNLILSTGGIEQIEDCSFSIKPVVTGGDEFTNLSIVIFARKGA